MEQARLQKTHLHGTAARVLTSGHPRETRNRVYDHRLPGPLKHDIVLLGVEGLQGSFGTAGMETVEKR